MEEEIKDKPKTEPSQESQEPQNPNHQEQKQETKVEIKMNRNSPTKFIIPIILILLIIFIGIKTMNPSQTNKVLLETNKGNIVIELYTNSPITTNNFKSLVEKGTYNNIIFHRVIKDFMIQGGDPTGTGMGDPSIPEIQDEYIQGNSNTRGTIAMANRGPNTGSSQFFINLVDNTNLDWDKQPLTSKHPVFGKVVEGMDVVDLIANTQTGAGDKPVEDVVILKASVM